MALAPYRRFVYPAPNACWQLDATEYVLAGGRKCVIFQLIEGPGTRPPSPAWLMSDSNPIIETPSTW
jgi:hypothetical protein